MNASHPIVRSHATCGRHAACGAEVGLSRNGEAYESKGIEWTSDSRVCDLSVRQRGTSDASVEKALVWYAELGQGDTSILPGRAIELGRLR